MPVDHTPQPIPHKFFSNLEINQPPFVFFNSPNRIGVQQFPCAQSRQDTFQLESGEIVRFILIRQKTIVESRFLFFNVYPPQQEFRQAVDTIKSNLAQYNGFKIKNENVRAAFLLSVDGVYSEQWLLENTQRSVSLVPHARISEVTHQQYACFLPTIITTSDTAETIFQSLIKFNATQRMWESQGLPAVFVQEAIVFEHTHQFNITTESAP